MQQAHIKLTQLRTRSAKNTVDDELQSQPYDRSAYQRLKLPAPPLHAIRTADGILHTDPSAIDTIMQEQWQNVFAGNVRDQLHTISCYVIKYIKFIFIATQAFHLDPLVGDDRFETCRNAPNSSSGLDHWSPAEFRLLSRFACNYLAAIWRLFK